MKWIEKLSNELSELNSSFVLSSNYFTRLIGEFLVQRDLNSIRGDPNDQIKELKLKAIILHKNIESKKELSIKIKESLSSLESEFMDTQKSIEKIMDLLDKNDSNKKR